MGRFLYREVFLLKKAVLLSALCLLILAAATSSALAETLGFGFVNNTDVALRRGIGGKTIVRLPVNACVWIKDSKTDNHGVLWYEVNAGIHIDYSNVDYTGWMKAEFVDAGETLWHDIQSVSVSRSGMIALKTDGTVEAAGSLVAPEASDWTAAREWGKCLRNIWQAGFCEHSMVRYALEQGGTCHQYGASPGILGVSRLRLIGGNINPYGITEDNRLVMGESEVNVNWSYPHTPSPEDLSHVVSIGDNLCRVLLLTDDGKVFASEDTGNDTEPEWENWTDIISIEAASGAFSGGRDYHTAYAAVRRNGTVIAAPEELSRLIENWTDMAKIVIGDRWVLGLKQDGSVLSAGYAGAVPPDVSGWKDIVDIGTGYDYCVGIRKNGTAVFAGEYIFMREGHNRK